MVTKGTVKRYQFDTGLSELSVDDSFDDSYIDNSMELSSDSDRRNTTTSTKLSSEDSSISTSRTSSNTTVTSISSLDPDDSSINLSLPDLDNKFDEMDMDKANFLSSGKDIDRNVLNDYGVLVLKFALTLGCSIADLDIAMVNMIISMAKLGK